MARTLSHLIRLGLTEDETRRLKQALKAWRKNPATTSGAEVQSGGLFVDSRSTLLPRWMLGADPELAATLSALLAGKEAGPGGIG